MHFCQHYSMNDAFSKRYGCTVQINTKTSLKMVPELNGFTADVIQLFLDCF